MSRLISVAKVLALRALRALRGIPSRFLDVRRAPAPTGERVAGLPESPLEVRARFWKGVREGQLEAESRSAGAGR